MTFHNHFGQNSNWKTHSSKEISVKLAEGQNVLVAGWVHFLRDKGKLIFVQAKKLTLESVITVDGVIRHDERVKLGGAEIIPNKLIIHAIAAPGLPLDINQKTHYEVDTAFKYRELSIRTPRVRMIMEIKAEVAYAIRHFFRSRDFVEIYTPYILATSTEGGAEKFDLNYFGTPAVLAQSNQFYKQAAIVVHEKVFGILPSWRAEKSRTTKHLVEFHQIENEIAFGTEETIMEIQEHLLYNVLQHVKKNCVSALEELNREDLRIPTLPFKRLAFDEAKDLLEIKLDIQESRDKDYSTPAETALSHHFPDPFFITKFPAHLRGLYYETDPRNKEITNSLDLMAPEGIGELSSGGKRVSSKEQLMSRIQEAKMNPDNFSWYLRMFEYGMPPHAGYGLGFERLIRWICGLEHVREVAMFPRTPDLVTP